MPAPTTTTANCSGMSRPSGMSGCVETLPDHFTCSLRVTKDVAGAGWPEHQADSWAPWTDVLCQSMLGTSMQCLANGCSWEGASRYHPAQGCSAGCTAAQAHLAPYRPVTDAQNGAVAILLQHVGWCTMVHRAL